MGVFLLQSTRKARADSVLKQLMNSRYKRRLSRWVVASLPLLASLSTRAQYASAVTSLNPVAYYRLDTTNAVPIELSSTNSGSLGTVFSGEYQSMAGSRGVPGAIVADTDTAVSIAGATGQQVVIPFSPSYNPSGPFSVEFWAKPDNVNGGRHAAAISMVNGQNKANGDDRSGWCVLHSGSDWQVILGFDHSDGTTFYGTTLTAGGTAIEGVWQHVVAVYDGTDISLYVNGTQVASQPTDKPMLPNTGAPLILGDRGYTGWDYTGQLDEFALYTSALSASEVKAHYDNGLDPARSKPYPTLVQEKAPSLYLRLGEPSLQLPVAVNSGSWGTGADGKYLIGTTPGVPGLQSPATTGFSTTNPAVAFNGASGSITIPGQNLDTDTATFTCWIRRDGDQPTRAGIMHHRGPNTKATGLGFHDSGNALSYNWEDFGQTYNFNPGFVPPDKTWTFVAVTVQSDQAVLYMGTASGLVSAINIFAHPTHSFADAPIELGLDNFQPTRVMKGEIDEFAIFDKTLSGDEIRSLYNAALPAILGITRVPSDPIYEGLKVTFQAAVAGSSPSFQWKKDGVDLVGKTGASLVLDAVVPADVGDYSVIVKTGGKTLTSAVSPLAILSSAPQLVQTPVSVTRFLNGSAQFRAASVGSQPLTYAWKHGSEFIPGATNALLSLSDLQPSAAGEYTVVVTNPLGVQSASATLTLVVPTQFSAAAVDAGPIGYWRLDEATGGTAYDLWGGRDGTVDSTVTNGVAGPRPTAFKGFDAANLAYDFNGGAEVDIPPLNLNKSTMTIVAWIKPNGTPDDYDGIVFSRGGGTVAGLDFQQRGQLGYHWNDTADTYNWSSELIPAQDTWNFVALVVEPALGKIYLDDGSGLVSAENAVNHSSEEFDGTLRFGTDGNGSRFYKGTLDDVVIYDRALSSAEITTLRDAGIAGIYAPVAANFAKQPKSQTIMTGASHTFSAKVTGSVPLGYKWQKDGTDIPGAVGSSLTISQATIGDSGEYQLVVTQGALTLKSTPVSLVVKPTPAYVDLRNDLVLHMKFEGDYKDSSGRANDGSAVGSPALVAGKIGSQALNYSSDGSTPEGDNYITLGERGDLQFEALENFTVSLWFRFTNPGTDLPFISNDDWGGGGEGFYFGPYWDTTGTWFWSLHSLGNTASVEAKGTGTPINDGNWHHFLASFDWQGVASTYLDGVLASTIPLEGAGVDVSTGISRPTNIGATGNPGIYRTRMTADIDDIGIWRRALNPYEAQAIHVVGQQYGRSFDDAGPVITDPELKIVVSGTALEIQWLAGTLEATSSLSGGEWKPVVGAAAPKYTVAPGSSGQFYRVRF